MAYATSPGSLYNRMQMLVISLAPFVVISLGLTMLAGFGMMNTTLYFMLATMHAASCRRFLLCLSLIGQVCQGKYSC